MKNSVSAGNLASLNDKIQIYPREPHNNPYLLEKMSKNFTLIPIIYSGIKNNNKTIKNRNTGKRFTHLSEE